MYVTFSLSVQGAGGLVQQHDLRRLQQRPGNSNPLFLATAQPQPPFADLRVITLGEPHDPIVNIGGPSCLYHLRILSRQPSVLDVVHDSVIEQHRVLRHHSDGVPQGFLGDSFDVLPVYYNGPGFHVVKPEQQPYNGAFAAS